MFVQLVPVQLCVREQDFYAGGSSDQSSFLCFSSCGWLELRSLFRFFFFNSKHEMFINPFNSCLQTQTQLFLSQSARNNRIQFQTALKSVVAFFSEQKAPGTQFL